VIRQLYSKVVGRTAVELIALAFVVAALDVGTTVLLVIILVVDIVGPIARELMILFLLLFFVFICDGARTGTVFEDGNGPLAKVLAGEQVALGLLLSKLLELHLAEGAHVGVPLGAYGFGDGRLDADGIRAGEQAYFADDLWRAVGAVSRMRKGLATSLNSLLEGQEVVGTPFPPNMPGEEAVTALRDKVLTHG
jgi:hypothetical protein